MDDIISTNTTALNLCDCCFKKVTDDDTFCNNCGYPLKGSEVDQKTFIVNRANMEIDLAASDKKVKTAENILYWIAGGTLLTGVIFYFTNNDESKVAMLIINIILAIVYIGLGAWSKTKPFAAIVSGFALYMIILILNMIVDPASIARGIIIKIIFIGYFINGIKSAIEAEKIKKELNIE